MGAEKIAQVGHKNEDFSESVCSFHSGAIFLSSVKQKLSNDALVVSIPLSERISLVSTGSGMPPGHDKNLDFSRFRMISLVVREDPQIVQERFGRSMTFPVERVTLSERIL